MGSALTWDSMTSAHLHTPSAINHPRWGCWLLNLHPCWMQLFTHHGRFVTPHGVDSADTVVNTSPWWQCLALACDTQNWNLFGWSTTDSIQWPRALSQNMSRFALDQIFCRPNVSWGLSGLRIAICVRLLRAAWTKTAVESKTYACVFVCICACAYSHAIAGAHVFSFWSRRWFAACALI